MNIRRISVLILVAACAPACGKLTFGAPPDSNVHDFGDALPNHEDAYVHEDAGSKVFEDAHDYEDAHVYEDAPAARACINVSQTFATPGVETIYVTFTCSSPDDAGPATIGVFGRSNDDSPYGEAFAGTVACGSNVYVIFPNWDDLLVTRISTATYDVSCN